MKTNIPTYIRVLSHRIHLYGHYAVARECFNKGIPVETVLMALKLKEAVYDHT